jgi:hypothetical protein
VLFAYLFYRIDQRQFLNYIVDNGIVKSREEALRIKDVARVNGYVLKNCKLYAWACWRARGLGRPTPRPQAFEVSPVDARVLRRLNLKHLDPRRGYDPYAAYSLASFDALTAKMLASVDLRNYIGKFVSKKMGFLMRSFGETRHDLETQLKESAILAWYKQYPRFDSSLHMVNVAKAQIHNTGQTMITSLTSKSRQRLTQNADGSFEALSVDISVVANEIVAPPQYGAMLHDWLQAMAKVEPMLKPRARDFLLCCAGHHHAGLSAFLQVNNEDAADEWPYQRYMAKVQEYFQTTPERVEKLFNSIRKYADQTNVR